MLTNLQGGKDWRSDASVAYAILRITLGVNIGLRGMVRIAHGPAAFAQGIVKQMEATILSASLVYAFAVPFTRSARRSCGPSPRSVSC